jgi:hypothetical protein
MIDWNRPLRTRSGNPAVLMGKLPDPHDGLPMVVRIYMDSRWEVDTYTVEGVFNPYSGDDELRSLDLVNVPELAMAQP